MILFLMNIKRLKVKLLPSPFKPHHFQRDICLPWVDVTKFDGSNPTGWVTQMEHYFFLYNITDDLAKLRYGVLHLDQERWQWWQWRKTSRQGYIAWTQFVAKLYECFDTDTNHLGRLTKLKAIKHNRRLHSCI
jgi:hypothetical protein